MSRGEDIKPPPDDYLEPEWAPHWFDERRAHNWRNYISDELRAMWGSFTPEQKMAIARNADELASAEDWD